MPKRRFPDQVTAQIASIIRAAAYTIRDAKIKEARERKLDQTKGVTNAEIVEKVKDDAHRIFGGHYKELTEHYLSTAVPHILEGKSAERRISTTRILPGLDLAEWLAVPPSDHKGSEEWKIPFDCTPDDLQRIEDRRRLRIDQEIAELEKLRIVRNTALERGCDRDKPISTVFEPPDHPSGRPSHHAPPPSPA